MHIQSIPMWEGSGNNYAYLVSDDKTREAVIIDPANPPDHHDHAGGNKEILKYQKLPIIGGRDCNLVTSTPSHKSTFKIGSIEVTALHTPCHTQDSICFYFKDGDDKAVFTGDTMFIGGCGRFFEGTAEEMHEALNKTLAALPDDTKVYPGHEYTKGNVKFAKTVANNAAVKKLDEYSQANKETQGKFTIGDEKKHNVFMLFADPEIQKATGQTEPVEVVRTLRAMKDKS
ncbi:Cytoplasmic glyoxalase II [Neodidymelliopsis sp. IMI 364377]|nr:Cytoplasmic glyoxalase II [Neodidymelliopsis sp. IMI 364377]